MRSLLLSVMVFMAVFTGQGFEDKSASINQKLSFIHWNLDNANIINPDDFTWLQKLVLKDNDTISSSHLMVALHLLGKCYLKQKEYANLHACIGYVSQLSDDEARYALICMTERGQSEHAHLFFQYFIEQIQNGDRDALCSMGIFRYYGMYCVQDRNDALKIFKALARCCNRQVQPHPVLVAMLAKSN